MKPINIDKQIKEKLQKRELQPSAHAWDRLDAMLSVAEEANFKKAISWNLKYFAVAAALLLIGSLIFMILDNAETEINNSIVIKAKQPVQEIETRNDKVILPETEAQVAGIETINSVKKEEQVSAKSHFIQNNIPSQKINHQSKSVLDNPSNKQEIAEVMLSKQKDKQIILSVSDLDLFASVDNAAKTNNQKTVQINSKNMLYQVSSEINQEYRETNFQTLKRNFEIVKVAVSNRNNQ
jgi:hypothetical protein